jgi:hypothetical protein
MHVVFCRLEQDAIYAEISNRLKKSKVGAELLRLHGNKIRPHNLRELHKALEVERISTVRLQEESNDDLMSIAVEGATGAFKQIGQSIKLEMPEVTYPLTPLAEVLPVKPTVSKQWEIINGAMERKDFALMQEYYLPALQGENISERARQTLRNHFEEWKAKKRSGITLSLDEVKVKEEVLPTWESLADLKKAYEVAFERYGQKGRKFLDTLKNTENITEASASVGISRQMGHKYLIEIRKKLTLTKK